MIYDWHIVKTDVIAELEDNKVLETLVDNRVVALMRREGSLYAFAATCPHAGARFCDGWTDPQGRIVCPLHKYRFDPANGRNTSGEGYKLKTYPVEIKDGEIHIGL